MVTNQQLDLELPHAASLAVTGYDMNVRFQDDDETDDDHRWHVETPETRGSRTTKSCAVIAFPSVVLSESIPDLEPVSPCFTPQRNRQEHLGLSGAVMVQLVCCIGASILFYPYLYVTLGYVLGVLFLVFGAVLQGGMTLVLYYVIVELKKLHPGVEIPNLETVSELCFGANFRRVFWVVLQATFLIVCTTFLILIGEIMVGYYDLAPGEEVANIDVSQWYWSLIFGAIQLVLSFIPDMRGRYFQYVAYVGTFASFVVIMNQIIRCSVMISNGFIADQDGDISPEAFADLGSGIAAVKVALGTMTTFVYGYSSLLVTTSAVHDMGPKNHTQFPKSVVIAMCIVTAIYLIFGVLGYAAYGKLAPPAFLNPQSVINQGDSERYWQVAGAATITGTTATVVILFQLLFRGVERYTPESKKDNFFYRTVVRFSVVAITMGLSCTPISYFTELSGLVPMSTMALIMETMPALFYWSSQMQKFRQENPSVASEKDAYFSVIKRKKLVFAIHSCVVILSVIFVIFGFWTSFDSLVDKINDDAAEARPNATSQNL